MSNHWNGINHKSRPLTSAANVLGTLQTMTNNKKSNLIWKLPYVIITIGLLFAFMAFDEFYNVKIATKEPAYPFGPINDNQWYYQKASIYASYSLTVGIIFLATSLMTIWETIKKNRNLAILGIWLTLLFFIAAFISRKVQ